MITFAKIKRGGCFWFRGQEWRRIRGRWALPVRLIGEGYAGFYFDINTVVEVKGTNHEQD